MQPQIKTNKNNGSTHATTHTNMQVHEHKNNVRNRDGVGTIVEGPGHGGASRPPQNRVRKHFGFGNDCGGGGRSNFKKIVLLKKNSATSKKIVLLQTK